jgi:hypothetical protein
MYGREKLAAAVTFFRHLGIKLQSTETAFNQHIKEMTTAAMRAMQDINKLSLLSLEITTALFKVKKMPILTYRLELIWQQLTETSLH